MTKCKDCNLLVAIKCAVWSRRLLYTFMFINVCLIVLLFLKCGDFKDRHEDRSCENSQDLFKQKDKQTCA